MVWWVLEALWSSYMRQLIAGMAWCGWNELNRQKVVLLV